MMRTTENSSPSTGKVLVVDDEKNVRILLAKILSRAGNEIFSTSDGRKVKEICEKHDVDVILLDVKMPIVGGMEVCESIRADHPSIPIIMVTGMTDPSICQKAITVGANDFIAKPIEAGKVLISVKNAIQMRRLQLNLSAQTDRFNQMAETILNLQSAQFAATEPTEGEN
jgi:DNA-binding NtrC family response regulator